MENQSYINSSDTSPVDAVPIIQPSSPSQTKTNLLVPLLTFLVSAAVFSFAGYYLGSQSNKTAPAEKDVSAPISETDINTLGVSPSSAVITNKTLLSDALSEYCLNNKIALDKLPFSLSQGVKNAYKIQTTIDCFVPDESYASMSIVVQAPDFSGDDRGVYFFHQNSKWMGMGDNFQPLINYHQITVNGDAYWLNVREPGPYGISTSGVWIDMIGEKKDTTSGTIVRIIDNEILEDQDLIDVVKKYGVKQTDPDFPEYIITDPAKKTQFIEEIVNLASQHNAFKALAENVLSDLNGISF